MNKFLRMCALASVLTISMAINGYTQDEIVNGVRTITNFEYVTPEPIVIEIQSEPEEGEITEVVDETVNTYSGINISKDEIYLLRQIVAAESQTESVVGRRAVAEVIFNRVLDSRFPNSVYGVLSQKGQFSSWRLRNASWVVPSMAVEAIDTTILNGQTVLPNTEYVVFSTSRQSYGYDYIKIGHHWFGKMRR